MLKSGCLVLEFYRIVWGVKTKTPIIQPIITELSVAIRILIAISRILVRTFQGIVFRICSGQLPKQGEGQNAHDQKILAINEINYIRLYIVHDCIKRLWASTETEKLGGCLSPPVFREPLKHEAFLGFSQGKESAEKSDHEQRTSQGEP